MCLTWRKETGKVGELVRCIQTYAGSNGGLCRGCEPQLPALGLSGENESEERWKDIAGSFCATPHFYPLCRDSAARSGDPEWLTGSVPRRPEEVARVADQKGLP